MVSILAQRGSSVGSSPNHKGRVITCDVENQLKWAIEIDEAISISKENCDEDQKVSHHLLTETEHTCDEPLTLKERVERKRKKKSKNTTSICATRKRLTSELLK